MKLADTELTHAEFKIIVGTASNTISRTDQIIYQKWSGNSGGGTRSGAGSALGCVYLQEDSITSGLYHRIQIYYQNNTDDTFSLRNNGDYIAVEVLETIDTQATYNNNIRIGDGNISCRNIDANNISCNIISPVSMNLAVSDSNIGSMTMGFSTTSIASESIIVMGSGGSFLNSLYIENLSTDFNISARSTGKTFRFSSGEIPHLEINNINTSCQDLIVNGNLDVVGNISFTNSEHGNLNASSIIVDTFLANSITTFADDVDINGNVDIGDLYTLSSFNNSFDNLSVNNASIINLSITGSITGSNLSTAALSAGNNISILNGSISAYIEGGTDWNVSSIHVDNDVEIFGNLNVSETSTFQQSLNVQNQLFVGDAGNVNGQMVLYSDLIGNNLVISNNGDTCSIKGEGLTDEINISLGGNEIMEIFQNDVFINGNLSTSGTASILGNLNVCGTITGTLGDINSSVINSSTLNSKQINNSTIDSDTAIISTINSSIINVCTRANVFLMNNSTLNSIVINNSTLHSDLANISVINSSTINVCSDVNISGNLNVSGILNVTFTDINTSVINNSTLNSITINTSTINSDLANVSQINNSTLNSIKINNSTLDSDLGNISVINASVISTTGDLNVSGLSYFDGNAVYQGNIQMFGDFITIGDPNGGSDTELYLYSNTVGDNLRMAHVSETEFIFKLSDTNESMNFLVGNASILTLDNSQARFNKNVNLSYTLSATVLQADDCNIELINASNMSADIGEITNLFGNNFSAPFMNCSQMIADDFINNTEMVSPLINASTINSSSMTIKGNVNISGTLSADSIGGDLSLNNVSITNLSVTKGTFSEISFPVIGPYLYFNVLSKELNVSVGAIEDEIFGSSINLNVLNASRVDATNICYEGPLFSSGKIDWRGFGNKIETFIFNGSTMNASFSDSINASVTNDLQVDGQIDTFDLVSDTGSITTFDSTTANVSTLNASILNNAQGNFSIVNASDITYIGSGATAGTIDWKGFGNKIETYLFNGSVMNASKLDAINTSMTGVLDVDTINASTINGDNLSTASILFNSDFQFSLNTLSLAPGQTSAAIQTATLNTIATQVDSATGNFSTINSDFATIGGTLNSNSINVSTLNYSNGVGLNFSATNISLSGSLSVNAGSGFGTPVKIGRTTIGNTSFDNMLSLGVDNNTTGSNYNFGAVANNQTIMNIANSTTHNSFRAENVEVMRNTSVGLGIKTLSDPTNALEVNGTINTSNISSINGSFTNITATSITAPNVQPLISDGDLTIARTNGLQTALDSKQETLTAGTNITIVGNTISATGSVGQNISATNISLTGSLTVNPGSGFGTPVKIGRTTIGNTSFDNMLSLGVDNNTTGSNYNFGAVANNQTIMNITNSTTHNSFRAENVEVMRNTSVGLGIKTLSDPTNALEVNGTINTSNISSINGSFTNLTATSITAPNVQPLIGDGDLTIARTNGLQTALDSKQETLTAGTNITIVGNTISASGGTTFDPTNISNTNLSSVNITATSFNATNITGNVSGGNVNCDVLMVSQNGEGIINGYDVNHAIHIRKDGQNELALHEFGFISFYTSGTLANQVERMRIGQNGYVGIGTTNPSTRLHVDGQISYSKNWARFYRNFSLSLSSLQTFVDINFDSTNAAGLKENTQIITQLAEDFTAVLPGYYRFLVIIGVRNSTYNNRVVWRLRGVKNGTFNNAYGQTFTYTRHDDYGDRGTLTCEVLTPLVIGDIIKFRIDCGKASYGSSFSSAMNGLQLVGGASCSIEYLGQ